MPAPIVELTATFLRYLPLAPVGLALFRASTRARTLRTARADNRLVATLQDVGGIAATTQFTYDAQDNLTRVTDPKGLNTGYTYNGLGDLLQLTSPDTGITQYSYDSAGNRQSQTDARGKTQTYTYDALNRLTQHRAHPQIPVRQRQHQRLRGRGTQQQGQALRHQ